MGKNNEIRQQNEDSILETELAVELKALINQIEGLDEYRLPQRAYHIIRIAIRDLILPPGKTILEREMAEILDMSRTPVREALVRLETEGVVRLIPRRGFIVKPIEKEDLPKRVAQIEPVVSRVEDKVDELVAKVDSMGTSIGEVKSAQKGMIWVVGAIVGLIQLVPVVKDLLTGG